MTYNLDEGWIGLRYIIEAPNPRQAIDCGARELFVALGIKRQPRAADFIAMEAEPYLDPEFAEPLTFSPPLKDEDSPTWLSPGRDAPFDRSISSPCFTDRATPKSP